MDYAIFGTGCFWCTEAVFQDLKGVEQVESGYSNGHVENPTYEQVCGKQTGHAEVVKITFDPTLISYPELLEIFWLTHDPTTPNRQGNDVGPQYRSALYYHNEAQQAAIQASKEAIESAGVWDDPIVTEIAPLMTYYPAEAYHQNYFKRVGERNPYCVYVVSPKVAKFKQMFAEKLKT